MTLRDLAPETIIDERYSILSRIGSGGMADVYCAQDLQLGRKVALKLLYRRFAEDEEFVERFKREASAAAGLQHPNVVGVYDRGEWDGTYYIAMEYLEGRTLKQLLQEEGPLAPERAIDIVVQILRAARFAHQRGVIHRDIKPHNVIIDEEGRAKVTDFGIARAGASDMTETGSIMGTAQYLSPEQAQGHAVSAQSDLYAIGIVIYELLTGRVPFDGDSPVTIALKQVSELPVPPSAYAPAVTQELDAIVLRALEKDPARRFADAEEFIAALEHCKAALVAVPAGQSTAVFGAVPDPTAATAVADGGAPPPPTEDELAAMAYPEQPLPPEDEEERRRRRNRWLIGLAVVLLLAGAGLAFALTRPEKAAVPDVVGKQFEAARTVLINAGFKVERQGVTSSVGQGPRTARGPAAGHQDQEGLDRHAHRLRRAGHDGGARRDESPGGASQEGPHGAGLQDHHPERALGRDREGARDPDLALGWPADRAGDAGHRVHLQWPRQGDRAERHGPERGVRHRRAVQCGPEGRRHGGGVLARTRGPFCARAPPGGARSIRAAR